MPVHMGFDEFAYANSVCPGLFHTACLREYESYLIGHRKKRRFIGRRAQLWTSSIVKRPFSMLLLHH